MKKKKLLVQRPKTPKQIQYLVKANNENIFRLVFYISIVEEKLKQYLAVI